MRAWLAVPVGFVVSVAIAGPAGAGASGDGWVRDGDIGASAGSGGTSPGSGGGGGSDGGGGGGGGGSGCTYTMLDEKMSGYADSLGLLGLGETRGAGAGGWYRKVCPDGSATVVWLAAAAAAPAVDPAVLA